MSAEDDSADGVAGVSFDLPGEISSPVHVRAAVAERNDNIVIELDVRNDIGPDDDGLWTASSTRRANQTKGALSGARRTRCNRAPPLRVLLAARPHADRLVVARGRAGNRYSGRHVLKSRVMHEAKTVFQSSASGQLFRNERLDPRVDR